MKEQRKQFLYANTENLLLDSARGNGEYINALAQLSGCRNEVANKIFARTIQQNFERIYFEGVKSATPEKIGPRIDKLIKLNARLRYACKITS